LQQIPRPRSGCLTSSATSGRAMASKWEGRKGTNFIGDKPRARKKRGV
jgi:hypothetical protein